MINAKLLNGNWTYFSCNSAVIHNHSQSSVQNGTQTVRGLDNNAMFHLEADFRKKVRLQY